MAPVFFGFGQVPRHGPLPRLVKDRDGPGLLTALFLHVPIGMQYPRALREEGSIERSDVRKALPFTAAFAASSIVRPNVLLRDKNSPYRFTAKQVGRHTGGN
jgi:hypothetical protein